jgi:PAS domain S-box-containing protein
VLIDDRDRQRDPQATGGGEGARPVAPGSPRRNGRATATGIGRAGGELERECLALIFDEMTEAVIAVDRDGRTVATNNAYAAQFGAGTPLVPQDAAGVPLPEADWPQHRAARGETFSMSFTRPDPDTGERRWYEAAGRGSSGDSSGDAGGVVVVRDITDRRLRHLQERFMDSAGHELQTPLAALHNYMQLVARGASGVVDAETQGYLDGAIEQIRRLADLAARLFDISVLRRGRAVVRVEDIDLRDLVDDVVREARIVRPDQPIDLRLGRRAAVVRNDELRLRQVLANLLGNALTHGASAGGASVKVSTDAGGGAKVTVADRGPGIAPALEGRLFTPFARGPEAKRGLGLGLYLSREIVEELGGSLTVRRRRGGGTLATLRLPRQTATRRRTPAGARRP